MAKIRTLLRCRKGMTLMEMLASVIILVMLTGTIAMAVPATMRTYRDITTSSEAAVLASTLSIAVNEQLRRATAISGDEDNAVFDCAYGKGVSFGVNEHGQVAIGEYLLLSPVAYTSDLTAQIEVGWHKDEGYFSVVLDISAPTAAKVYTAEYTVATLNR